ncbi:E3 ubiquitin-protein ligase RNF38 [Symbiodinium microadriaticum]|uniref:E3 ubiquitin-protein ligase RNF38 n=1 Tax=Symbiodinium microadriaticum TaxID=2951 RepID=A0A1Q9ERH3_SYMMI|nr:E3 ubiquitin-protein ligase RNF38 [Symbiodinium microadriaticum]CAE7172986.1 Rnf38 [Symbiodinium microadriaticum]
MIAEGLAGPAGHLRLGPMNFGPLLMRSKRDTHHQLVRLAADATMPPILRRAIRSAQRRVLSFFDGNNAQAEDNPEPLLDVVQQYPAEAAWFIKVVMFYGSVSSLVTVFPCCLFLMVYWSPCRLCNRPLRCWLALHCILQLLQAPVRMVFYYRVREIQRLNGDLQECVRQLTQAPAWRTSKAVSITSYAWFVLGVVWLLNSSYCEPCPWLYRLSLMVVVFSFLKLLITLVVFNRCFPVRGEASTQHKPRGAPQELIDALPVHEFGSEEPAGQEDDCSAATAEIHHRRQAGERRRESSCAVCLCDFERKDLVRRLPCNHVFHQSCIDRWLRRNQVCPLCLREVKAPSENSLARRLLGDRKPEDRPRSGLANGKAAAPLPKRQVDVTLDKESLKPADTCWNCGNRFMPDSEFCRRCGTKRDMVPVVQADRFGFANVPGDDGRSLQITWIDPDGLLAKWNAEHPDLQVNEGDQVVAVNSFTEDVEAMRTQLQQSRIRMAVKVFEEPDAPGEPDMGRLDNATRLVLPKTATAPASDLLARCRDSGSMYMADSRFFQRCRGRTETG